MDEEEHEQTLLIKKECFIYRIPPRPGAAGYKAQDWDPSTYIWSGRLIIISRGDLCTIKFEDTNSGEIFAQCPVEQNSVEPVIDSSRYFVIKIKDGDRHAVVGMGFTDRNDAFDFNVTLQDHQNHVRNKRESHLARQQMDNQPKKDYSLKTGQTIHIPFKASNSSSPTTQKSVPTVTGASSGGGFLLSPPPPAGGRSVRQPTQQQQPVQQQNQFSFQQSAPQQQQQQNNQFSFQPQQQQQQQNNQWGSNPFF